MFGRYQNNESQFSYLLTAVILLFGLLIPFTVCGAYTSDTFMCHGVISGNKIESAVKKHFYERWHKTALDVRIEKIIGCRDITAPDGKAQIIVYTEEAMPFKRRVAAHVTCVVEPDFEHRQRVIVELEIKALVAAAAKPIARLQPIQAEDLVLVKLDLTQIPRKSFTSIEDVVGLRARRKIAPQTVLREDLVEKPPLVQRGDMVTVLVNTGGLSITAVGRVRQAGSLGDLIQVMNIDSNKQFQARVLDANTVVVDLSNHRGKGNTP